MILFSLFVFLAPPSFAGSLSLITCANSLRSPEDPRYFDVSEALSLLDFAAPPEFSANAELPNLDSKRLATLVPARIKVLRGIFAQAGHIQSAQVFLRYFDSLKSLPHEILVEHENIDDRRVRRRLLQVKTAVVRRTGDAFDLTLVTLANRHPLMMLRDPRVISHLARIFMTEYHAFSSVPELVLEAQNYRDYRDHVHDRISVERGRLLSENVLGATVNSKSVARLWQRALIEASDNPHDLEMATMIAEGLRIRLLPVKNKKTQNLRPGLSTNSVSQN